MPREGPGTTEEVEVSLRQVEDKLKAREQQLQELRKTQKKQEDNLQKDIDKKRYIISVGQVVETFIKYCI